MRAVGRLFLAEMTKIWRTKFPYFGLAASALVPVIAKQLVDRLERRQFPQDDRAVIATRGRESTRASFTCPNRRLAGEPDRAGPQNRVPHRTALRTDTGALLSAGEVWRAIRPGNRGLSRQCHRLCRPHRVAGNVLALLSQLFVLSELSSELSENIY